MSLMSILGGVSRSLSIAGDELENARRNVQGAVGIATDIERVTNNAIQQNQQAISRNTQSRAIIPLANNNVSTEKQERRKPRLVSKYHHIQSVLDDYGVKAIVTGDVVGTVITRYSLKVQAGFKLEKSVNNSLDDISRELGLPQGEKIMISVNAGDGLASLDLPLQQRGMIEYKQVMKSGTWEKAMKTMELPMMQGEFIDGEVACFDMAKAPMMGVAGRTGSGKSVGVNVNLVSMLSCRTTDEVKLWMIDPKIIELTPYNGIPHLIDPVATDMRDGVDIMRKAVAEMDSRYKLFAENKVKNIQGYRKKTGKPLATILIVLEEMADAFMDETLILMAKLDEYDEDEKPRYEKAGKIIENLVVRICQKARASGILFYGITQNPSADILPSLIRSNLPSRMSYAVQTATNSNTAMNYNGAGAEKLTGKGDGLILMAEQKAPLRFHGAMLSDDEFNSFINSLSNQ